MIAREIERRGIPTVCMSSAYSITEAVKPPRAVFLDFPLGHTAGKPGDRSLQRHIMIDTLSALDSLYIPGSIRTLPYVWDDADQWKLDLQQQHGNQPADDRTERTTVPQYQLAEDKLAAESELVKNGCPSCVFPEHGE